MTRRGPAAPERPPRAVLPLAPARDPRPGLSGLDPAVLEAWVVSAGQPAYRVRQIEDAVWRLMAAVPDEFRTLPVPLREQLGASFRVDTVGVTEQDERLRTEVLAPPPTPAR